MMGRLALLLMFCCATGGGALRAQTPDAYRAFLDALRSGADCPRLYALRKEARASSSVSEQAEMTRLVRSVGCITSTSKRTAADTQPTRETYTVREYRTYREVVDAPLYMAEQLALERAARKFRTTPAKVRAIAEKVTRILSQSDWAGSRATEERHASDWLKK